MQLSDVDMEIDKSEFYHFGLLPQVCIHSLDEDQYSCMYIPQESCEKCGCKEWAESTMKIVEDFMGFEYPKKRVHRCSRCNEIRMADHKGAKE